MFRKKVFRYLPVMTLQNFVSDMISHFPCILKPYCPIKKNCSVHKEQANDI